MDTSELNAYEVKNACMAQGQTNNDALPIEALFVGAGLNIGMNG
jgi:hypothetical protein